MRHGPSHREILLLALLYLAVAVAGTWPMVRAPATQSLASLTDNDFRLNIYLVFWGAHALATDPLRLHHTNMFHPEEYTYAYGDMLLADSLLALPLVLGGGGPHLVYNLLLLAILTLGALGFYVLARDLLAGLDRRAAVAAALLGGLIWAWNPAHFTRYQQIPLLGDHWMPWLAWALLRWLGLTPVLAWTSHRNSAATAGGDGPAGRRRSRGESRAEAGDSRESAAGDPGPDAGGSASTVASPAWAVAAAGFLCLHALTGSHNAVFGALFAGSAVPYAATVRGLWTDRRFWSGICLIVAVCVVVLGPVFYPYVLVEERMVEQRDEPLDDLRRGSAARLELLSARSNLYRWLDAELGWPSAVSPSGREPRSHLFPGVVALLLAGLGVLGGRAWRHRAVGLFLLFTGLAFLLALGPSGGLYLLLERIPLIRNIRVPSRFILPAAFGLSVLSAWGAGWLLHRGGRRLGAASLTALAVLFVAESTFVPLRTRPYDPFPGEVYVWLGERPGDFAVVEFPLDPGNHTIAMRQVFRSIHHWKKLLVGYSGFQTEVNVRRLEWLAREFPRDPAIDRLAGLDVRYVIVLEDRLSRHTLAELRAQERLREVRRWGAMGVYRLLP